MGDGLDPCGEAARTRDPDRFLASLFAPAPMRAGLWALLAFNQELVRAGAVVSEPHLGLIRLQWWREALEEIEHGHPARAHPGVTALAALHGEGRLDLARLGRIIDAREADLEPQPFGDKAALLDYAGATGGALHGALAFACGAGAGDQDLAEAAGRAWALMGLARATASGSLGGWHPCPRTLAPGGDAAFIRQLMELAVPAERAARQAAPGAGLPALLPVALLPLFRQRLARPGAYREPSTAGKLARITLAAMRRRV